MELIANKMADEMLKVKRKKKMRASDSTSKSFKELYQSTDEYLGEGSCGVVRTYISTNKRKEFAVKMIEKCGSHVRNKVLSEIEILHHCRGHPNIVQLTEFFEEDDRFYIVYEKMHGGTLFDWVETHGPLSEDEAKGVIADIARAVAFLHSKGIAHRDLKLENVLCWSPTSLLPVKICDFDLSSDVSSQHNFTEKMCTSPVGSADFMAPEVVDVWLNEAKGYTKACDLWSLGVMMYILLSGCKPFYVNMGPDCSCDNRRCEGNCTDCRERLFTTIQEATVNFPEYDWCDISSEALDLISLFLQRQPERRITAQEVLHHRWISLPLSQTRPILFSRGNSNSTTKGLNLVPSTTNICRDIQSQQHHSISSNHSTFSDIIFQFDEELGTSQLGALTNIVNRTSKKKKVPTATLR